MKKITLTLLGLVTLSFTFGQEWKPQQWPVIKMKYKTLAKKCRTLYEQGRKWMDDNLFNGEYYEHRITDPKTFQFLDMNDPDVKIPPYQLGPGCLVADIKN
jgi:uncharacterized protein (DUF608 family)